MSKKNQKPSAKSKSSKKTKNKAPEITLYVGIIITLLSLGVANMVNPDTMTLTIAISTLITLTIGVLSCCISGLYILAKGNFR